MISAPPSARFGPTPGLQFGAVNTDRMAIGQGASIKGLTSQTVFAWVKRTGALASGLGIYGGVDNVATSVSAFILRWSGTSGNVECRVQQTTTAASYITNDTPFSGTDWVFIAGSYQQGAAPRCHIYAGSLSAPVAERTYGTTNDGSGTLSAEDGTNGAYFGNRYNGGNTGSIPAILGGMCGIVPGILGVTDLERIRRLSWAGGLLPYPFAALYAPGENGTAKCLDKSGNGNTGTITGATFAQGPPLLSIPSRGLYLRAA